MRFRPMRNVIINDVLAYNIGIVIESNGVHYMKPMLKKDQMVPSETKHEFYTQKDCQESVLVIIQQGMHELAEDNDHVGEFEIVFDDNMAMRGAGKTCIEVTFHVDENHILTVNAVDNKTKKGNRLTTDFKNQRMGDERREQARARLANAMGNLPRDQ